MIIETQAFTDNATLSNEQFVIDCLSYYTAPDVETISIVLDKTQRNYIYGRIVDKIEPLYKITVKRNIKDMERAIIRIYGQEQAFYEILKAIPQEWKADIYRELIDVYDLENNFIDKPGKVIAFKKGEAKQ